jgi:hypothetical protein
MKWKHNLPKLKWQPSNPTDFDNIVRMARILPMRHSDLFFDFNRHIESTRTRLTKVKP